MNTYFIVILCCIISLPAWSKEISLIEDQTPAAPKKVVALKTPKSSSPPIEPLNPSLQEMKAFLKQEQEKIKEIKMLNLDLERAHLELKKKEIEVKLSALSTDRHRHEPSAAMPSAPHFKLAGIFIKGPDSRAMIQMDGQSIHIKKGQTIAHNIEVQDITSNAVVLKYPDGRQETLDLES